MKQCDKYDMEVYCMSEERAQSCTHTQLDIWPCVLAKLARDTKIYGHATLRPNTYIYTYGFDYTKILL